MKGPEDQHSGSDDQNDFFGDVEFVEVPGTIVDVRKRACSNVIKTLPDRSDADHVLSLVKAEYAELLSKLPKETLIDGVIHRDPMESHYRVTRNLFIREFTESGGHISRDWMMRYGWRFLWVSKETIRVSGLNKSDFEAIADGYTNARKRVEDHAQLWLDVKEWGYRLGNSTLGAAFENTEAAYI